ncbi:MAG: hypothetical protein J6X54_00370 [Treponema sp.]|nr:hypothetical protein [Treponema sp.]
MKRLFTVLFISAIFSLSAFAEERFFNERYFDVTIDLPVNFSNNLIGTKDVLQEKVLIDFTQIADNMGEDGFKMILDAKPKVSFGLDIPNGLVLKLNIGVDVYSTIGIGKALFDFIGYGNTINEDINIDVNGYADAFGYVGLDVGWNTKKFSLTVSPNIYYALFHLSADESKVVISNSESGEFGYDLVGNLAIHSDYQFFNAEGKFDPEFIFQNDYIHVLKNCGFDLTVAASYDLYRYLTLYGSARIPIYPCKINKVSDYKVTSSMHTTIMDIGNPQFNYEMTKSEVRDETITLNRPMKFNINGKFHPFNGVMDYYAGLGLGIEHPFASEGVKTDFYFDYFLGMRLGFWNVLNFYVSTERTDKIYSHKFKVDINLRIFELMVGVAAESSSFTGSFRGAGVGAFAQVSVGM